MEGAKILERDVSLSRSMLWELERRWYERAGERAWSDDAIPHYITTNPTMAAALAQVIAGWVRDGGLRDGGDAPLTILELGAGTGRLGWHVVRELGAYAHVVPRFRYVLSDVTSRTIQWWREHPQLAPLFRAAVLDVARVDAEAPDLGRSADDDGIDLLISGARVRGPLVVIATYLFDSLRTDAFAVRGGALHEKRLTLLAPAGHDPDGLDAIGGLGQAWREVPAGADHYGDPDLDAVLGSYGALGDDAQLTFPIAPLRLLRRLERIAGGRMLALIADKGFVDPEVMRGRVEPDLAHHGCISLPVNLHAITAWAARRGAITLATPPARMRLATIALAHGATARDELALAFDEAFGRAGPDDWYALKRTVERRYADCELDELLALVRTSRGDDNVLRGMASSLFERICEAPPSQLPGIRDALARVERAYYWVGEPADLPFLVGVGLHLAGDADAARAAFARALELHARAPRKCLRLARGGLWIGAPDDPRVIALEAEPLFAQVRDRLI